MIQIPNLTIDRDGDGPDVEVMLTQDFGGNEHMVTLHPSQVRVLCERMGLLAPDAEAQRTIARLSRQMRLLLERIDQLDDWLNQASQRGHEDLSMETTYSFASWEMANEFCKELPDVVPRPAKTSTAAAPPPLAFENNQTKSNGRGGARPGAGRKPACKTSAAAPVPGPATVIPRAEANVPMSCAVPPAAQLGLLEGTAVPTHAGGMN